MTVLAGILWRLEPECRVFLQHIERGWCAVDGVVWVRYAVAVPW